VFYVVHVIIASSIISWLSLKIWLIMLNFKPGNGLLRKWRAPPVCCMSGTGARGIAFIGEPRRFSFRLGVGVLCFFRPCCGCSLLVLIII
jgi:hypothetical protein